jgi:hypothetical protein
MKIGDLVKYIDVDLYCNNGDIGLIIRQNVFGVFYVQFIDGDSCWCVHFDLELINESR